MTETADRLRAPADGTSIAATARANGQHHALLSVRRLCTEIQTRSGVVRPVNDVSFDLYRGEVLGLVGESGSGKSMTLLSLLRMLPSPGGRIASGEILLEGQNLCDLSESAIRHVRGRRISMIMQDPMTSLDPLFTVGFQISEALPRRTVSVKQRVVDLLRNVRIPAPEARMHAYPHEMSGGMRQRVVAAIALASEPHIILADEPTTALDVTIQLQFLDLLRRIQAERDLAIILVTHDLSIVARFCDRAAVMYGGRIVEIAPVAELFAEPKHPYTQGLLRSIPRLGATASELPTIEGQPPDLRSLPTGCAFHPRCPAVMEICSQEVPKLLPGEDGTGAVACWLETPNSETHEVVQPSHTGTVPEP